MRTTIGRTWPLCCLVIGFASFRSAAMPQSPRQETQSADYSAEPLVVEKLLTKTTFENDGTSMTTSDGQIRIQSQAALQQFGMLSFSWASATSSMEVVYVRVIKPDNRVVVTPAENILDVPADITRQAPFYSDLKNLQVAVKGLQVGDTLEFETREQVKKPLAPGQFWLNFNFVKDAVALQEEWDVRVPHDRKVTVKSTTVQPTIVDDGAYRVYSWKTSNLKRKSPKEQSGENDSKPPDVQITTFQSWDELGHWVQRLFGPRAAPTADVQAKAQELTRGATSQNEKIQDLYAFVSTKFRYIGIALGIGRYQPHEAADVLSNDYGDCKDKHTLFASLLQAEDVQAYPALIGSDTKIDPDVPSPAQFDHVITAMPQGKGFLFLDTTPEVAPFGLLTANLRDKMALVVKRNGTTELVKTPADPPFPSFFHFKADATLNATGTLESKMQLTFRGDAEIVYRLALRQASQPDWKDVMQKISQNLGFAGTVSDVTASQPDATQTPFRIDYAYERKDYSDWDNKRITPPMPPVFLPAVSDDATKSPKPIQLGSPGESDYQTTVKLPPNAVPQLPAPVHLSASFAEYTATYSVSEGVLHAERKLVTKEREVAPGQIEAYGKFVKSVEDDENTFIPIAGQTAAFGTGGSLEAQALFEQGRQAWQLQDLQGAISYFQRAVQKDPAYAQAWMSLGALHAATGESDQAIDELKKAIALDPRQTYPYEALNAVLLMQHRPEDALAIWKDLEKTSPGNAEAPKRIAAILLSLKRYSEALPELEAAVNSNPENPDLIVQLGDTYLHTGDKEKAFPRFQQALALDSSANTLNSVAYDLADNNFQLDDALRDAEQAVKKEEDQTADITLDNLLPGDAETVSSLAAYWDTLGWVHFRLGHLDQAEKYLTAGWYLTQDPVIADHLGQLYEKEGKKHEAVVAYGRALAAGHAPERTQARLRALRPGEKYLAGERVSPAALQDFRVVKVQIARKPAHHASADFFLLFAPGPKVVAIKFLSGSEELRDAEKSLAAAKFDVRFPDDGPAQILRRGILDCEPEISGCMVAFVPPSSVHALK